MTRKELLALAGIVLIWAACILPSSFSPPWSFLDDPSILYVAKHFTLRNIAPDPQSGRFIPLFFLYMGALYKAFATNLAGHYLVKSLLFLVSALLIHWTIRRMTSSAGWGFLGALLFLTASPVAENAYTLAKSELLMSFTMAALFALFAALTARREEEPRLIMFSVLMTLAAATVLLSKEIAVALIAAPVVGIVLSFLLRRRDAHAAGSLLRSYVALSCSMVLAFLLVRGLKVLLTHRGGQDLYTAQYEITGELILANAKFYILQTPDVVILCILCCVLTVFVARRGLSSDPSTYVFSATLTAAAVALISGYLLWRWPLGYYLLPAFTLLAIALPLTVRTLAGSGFSGVMTVVLLIFILATRLYTLPYFAYIAKSQRTTDRAYTEAVATYMDKARPGERLIIEHWPFFTEPVRQTNILMQKIFGRRDLEAVGVRDIVDGQPISPEMLKLYAVKSIPEKSERMPRAGDFILILSGQRTAPWVLRGVSPSSSTGESQFQARGMTLEEIISKKFPWHGLFYEQPFFTPRIAEFSSGFSLYQVRDPEIRFTWEGRWSDGWIGESAVYRLLVRGGQERLRFTGAALKYNVPLTLTVQRGGKVLKRLSLHEPGGFSFDLVVTEPPHDGSVALDLRADRTFSAWSVGLNNDKRSLSVQIDVKRMGAESAGNVRRP